MFDRLEGLYIFKKSTSLEGISRTKGHCIKIRSDNYDGFYFDDLNVAIGNREKYRLFSISKNRLEEAIKQGKIIKYKNSED